MSDKYPDTELQDALAYEAEDKRRMKCPYCGHELETSSIGRVHCGPHKIGPGPDYYPAVRMVEIESPSSPQREGDRPEKVGINEISSPAQIAETIQLRAWLDAEINSPDRIETPIYDSETFDYQKGFEHGRAAGLGEAFKEQDALVHPYRARIAELEEAIKPFAMIPPVMVGVDAAPVYAAFYWVEIGTPQRTHFTDGDLRRARSVLALPQREGDRPAKTEGGEE